MAGITWAAPRVTKQGQILQTQTSEHDVDVVVWSSANWAAPHRSSSPLEHTWGARLIARPLQTSICHGRRQQSPYSRWALSWNVCSLIAVISSLMELLGRGCDSFKRCWPKRQLWIHVQHLHHSLRLFLRGCWALQNRACAGEDELWTCSRVFMGPGGNFGFTENMTALGAFLGLPRFRFWQMSLALWTNWAIEQTIRTGDLPWLCMI